MNMWSYSFTGSSSIFQTHQRTVLSTRGLPHDEGLIASLMDTFNLYVIIIDDLDDQKSVDAVVNATNQCIKEKKMVREDILIGGRIPVTWEAEGIFSAVTKITDKTREQTWDILLLPEPIVRNHETKQLDERKCDLAWGQMVDLKKASLVRNIGVTEFPIMQLDILLRRFEKDPPTLHEMNITPFKQRKHEIDFSHSRGMEVLARLPLYSSCYSSTVLQDIAEKHSNYSFKYAPCNETGRKQNNQIIKTVQITPPKTALQVVLRWMYQRGIMAVPITKSFLENYPQDFYRELTQLRHPFVNLPAEISPTQPPNFVLSPGEMSLITSMENATDEKDAAADQARESKSSEGVFKDTNNAGKI